MGGVYVATTGLAKEEKMSRKKFGPGRFSSRGSMGFAVALIVAFAAGWAFAPAAERCTAPPLTVD
jgi:hypothetical protein